jgi:uncharacterized membrane protein
VSPLAVNGLAFGFSVALILAYHGYLRFRLRRNQSYTIQAVNMQARISWVEGIMASRDRAVLAVQTLRNSTMAATFLASTAILLTIGVLNLMDKDGVLDRLFSTAHIDGGQLGENLWLMKLLPLLVAFFWAFFCFSQSIRMYNHVGYLINASSGGNFCPTPAFVARILNRSGHFYSLGMRAYYLSVPLVFWLLGPLYLVIASLGLVLVLYNVDRAPSSEDGRERSPSQSGGSTTSVSVMPRRSAGG